MSKLEDDTGLLKTALEQVERRLVLSEEQAQHLANHALLGQTAAEINREERDQALRECSMLSTQNEETLAETA